MKKYTEMSVINTKDSRRKLKKYETIKGKWGEILYGPLINRMKLKTNVNGLERVQGTSVENEVQST